MNSEEFNSKLQDLIHGRKISIGFLIDWYSNTLKQLDIMRDKSKGIEHPRHRGDAREYDIVDLLDELLPNRYMMTKGYAVNADTAKSLEQDCMICDTSYSIKFVSSGQISYLPVESIYASLEVKSKLDISELRKCIVNCVSLKRLLHDLNDDMDYDSQRTNGKICYSVFAYDSNKCLKEVASDLEKLSEEIPNSICIDMIYILGKGLILPKHPTSNGSYLSVECLQKFIGKYTTIDGIGTRKAIPKTEGLSFLFFISNIIDHCTLQSQIREKVEFSSYVFKPVVFQDRVEAIIERREKEKENET